MNVVGEVTKLFGYHLVNTRKVHVDVWVHLSHLFRRLNINCVIDVGANTGQYGAELRKIGFKGNIFSFEPVKESYAKLVEQISRDTRWQAFNLALGSENSTGQINVTSSSDFASFLPPNTYSQSVFQDKTSVNDVETVQIRRLDSLLPEIIKEIPEPRIFLKMDTQGYDLEVMNGATGCLDQIIAMQSELSVLPLYSGMPDYCTALNYFRELGFETSGIYTMSRDAESLLVIEFDCVMVKTGSLNGLSQPGRDMKSLRGKTA